MSPIHSLLTPDPPVLAFTIERHASGRVALEYQFFRPWYGWTWKAVRRSVHAFLESVKLLSGLLSGPLFLVHRVCKFGNQCRLADKSAFLLHFFVCNDRCCPFWLVAPLRWSVISSSTNRLSVVFCVFVCLFVAVVVVLFCCCCCCPQPFKHSCAEKGEFWDSAALSNVSELMLAHLLTSEVKRGK